MPKTIDLTVEICVIKVTCPGVWLCPDGNVALRIEALSSKYQTCLLPPLFPLMFKDVFYFRKRFKPKCPVSNLMCLVGDEIIYCELIQCPKWGGTKVLSKYLGTLDDVLFPPETCWSDGVDLLMRRSENFPGILSPKIEISTKIRIDESWETCAAGSKFDNTIEENCCDKGNIMRSKPVCHSILYHRKKHVGKHYCCSLGSKSCCSLSEKKDYKLVEDLTSELNKCSKKCELKSRNKMNDIEEWSCEHLENNGYDPLLTSSRSPDDQSKPPGFCFMCTSDTSNMIIPDSGITRCSQKCVNKLRNITNDIAECSYRELENNNYDPLLTNSRSPDESKPPEICSMCTSDISNVICPASGITRCNKAQHKSPPTTEIYSEKEKVPCCNHTNRSANYAFNNSLSSSQDLTLYPSSESYSHSHRIELKSHEIDEPEPNISTNPLKKSRPCYCDICRRYHELFHKDISQC